MLTLEKSDTGLVLSGNISQWGDANATIYCRYCKENDTVQTLPLSTNRLEVPINVWKDEEVCVYIRNSCGNVSHLCTMLSTLFARRTILKQ